MEKNYKYQVLAKQIEGGKSATLVALLVLVKFILERFFVTNISYPTFAPFLSFIPLFFRFIHHSPERFVPNESRLAEFSGRP